MLGSKERERRRGSESRQNDRKQQGSGKRGAPHNRSSSLHREKKPLRFHTDYGDYEQTHTAALQVYAKLQTHPGRRRGTFDCQAHQQTYKPLAVQSTKYDQAKNADIRGLFREREEGRGNKLHKPKGNHPLLKFLGKRKEKQASPQGKPQASREKSTNSQNYCSSTSKPKRSLGKKSIAIGKDHITLKQETKELSKEVKAQRETDVQSKVRREDQWTLKTVKRQREQSEEVGSARSTQSYGLTEEEEDTFGDRFPYGFEKVKLLGRGGFSLVWLGRHCKSGKEFAIKQIITQNTHQTHLKEIWFGTLFFALGGQPKPEFASDPGVKNLVRIYSYEINQTDTWIFYEKCGPSLGSSLYDIRSEKVYGQQKLYKVPPAPLRSTTSPSTRPWRRTPGC